MSEDGYRLVARTPEVEEYRRLRAATGLSDKSPEAATLGLAGTWFGVCVLDGDDVIGMGRIIGDGGTAFQITDIAVLPEHQRRGLGRRIMGALVEHLENHAPPTAYVSLIADGDAKRLYSQFGFAPVAPASIGMARRF